MYADQYSEEITWKLSKLKKRDPNHYNIVRKKMDQILSNPEHGHKFLHHDMKGINRVHIGHFVLAFRIDHPNKMVFFDDYDHHDNIYQKRI